MSLYVGDLHTRRSPT